MIIVHAKLASLRLFFALLALATVANSASAQDRGAVTPTLIRPADAAARIDADKAREAEAYALGVQTVIWGMQWVKAAQTMRSASAPLPNGAPRKSIDPAPHGVNTWGHAQELLTHELRLIETPNTETLYSVAIVDLHDGPVVIMHPDFGARYYRTSISRRYARHKPEERRWKAISLCIDSRQLGRQGAQWPENNPDAQPLRPDQPSRGHLWKRRPCECPSFAERLKTDRPQGLG